MKILLFEGTPDEYRSVADLFGGGNTNGRPAESVREVLEDTAESGDDAVEQEVSVEQAVQILKRLPLSDHIQTVLAHLAHAKGEVSSDHLRDHVAKLDGDQFRGMMGAFGRRVINTVRGQKLKFFEKRWNGDQYYWSLTENAKRAVIQLKLA